MIFQNTFYLIKSSTFKIFKLNLVNLATGESVLTQQDVMLSYMGWQKNKIVHQTDLKNINGTFWRNMHQMFDGQLRGKHALHIKQTALRKTCTKPLTVYVWGKGWDMVHIEQDIGWQQQLWCAYNRSKLYVYVILVTYKHVNSI